MHVLQRSGHDLQRKLCLCRKQPTNVSAVGLLLQEGKYLSLGPHHWGDRREQNSAGMWRRVIWCRLTYYMGRDSSVGKRIATGWTVRGSNPGGGGGEIFHTHPDRPWGRVFPGCKVAEAWRWSPTPSSAEVKERVELYIYSPSGPSWTVLRWTLPLPTQYSPALQRRCLLVQELSRKWRQVAAL